MNWHFQLIRVAVAATLVFGLTGIAQSGATDYVFEPVRESVKHGDAILAVRLVHKVSGSLVTDAIVVRTRIDMAPDGMATMASPLLPVPSPEPGTYAFKTDLSMAGRWLLSIAAKVQGEQETVIGKIIFIVTE